MGLCISVAKKIQPLKINGTTITQDEWEDMMMPDLDNFAYRLHPDRLKSDQKEYEQIQNYFEQGNEVDYLNMGYSAFNCYREIILRNAGVDMRAGNADNASDSDISIKKICPCFSNYMVDGYYYHWDDEKYTKEDDQRHVKDFFNREILYTYEIIKYIACFLSEPIDYKLIDSLFKNLFKFIYN